MWPASDILLYLHPNPGTALLYSSNSFILHNAKCEWCVPFSTILTYFSLRPWSWPECCLSPLPSAASSPSLTPSVSVASYYRSQNQLVTILTTRNKTFSMWTTFSWLRFSILSPKSDHFIIVLLSAPKASEHPALPSLLPSPSLHLSCCLPSQRRPVYI